MTSTEQDQLFATLGARFDQHPHRHPKISWSAVLSRLVKSRSALKSLGQMEATGGEPDVIGQESEQFLFCDCSLQSPAGRRSLCYDGQALASRKEHPPKGSVVDLANAMGIELLSEEQYRQLQTLGEFDTKTSSWIKTPEEMRELGGALFGDRRFGRVFVYHNGAESYYAARGFRGLLRV